jgi:plastocyanin
MFARSRTIFGLLALLLVSGAACAATFNVTVGSGGALAFTPSTLTIHVGDTVTWTNTGEGFHNVAANDASFRNGGASSSAWTFSHTFTSAGTVGYHCEIHGGMTGSITVNAATPTMALGGYLSGNWFDPSANQGGHGFQFEFTNQNNTLVAIWFVYPPNGGGQNWIYAQGPFDPSQSTVTIPAELLNGPKFPPLYNSADLVQTLWGTLTFSFTDCDHGTASWNSTVPGYGSGSIPIQRLSSIQGTTCPQ